MPSDVLEFTSNATHMQQVCNKDIDMYRTFFSRDTGECPFCAFLQAVHLLMNIGWECLHSQTFTKDVLSRVLQDELREVANKAVEKEYTDKKDKLESDISYLENMRRISRSLSEMDSRASKHISMEHDEKRAELQSVNEELTSAIEKTGDAAKLLDRIKNFVSLFRLFAPTIEEYANQIEADKTIEAGNSFRGILNELGKLS